MGNVTLFIWRVSTQPKDEDPIRVIVEHEHYRSMAYADAVAKNAVADKFGVPFKCLTRTEVREAKLEDYDGLENEYLGLWM